MTSLQTPNGTTNFIGDRIWFGNGKSDVENPLTYRGIVHNVGRTKLGIIPLQSKIDGTNRVWHVDTENVFLDFCDLTLRFNVGDPVLCCSNYWIARAVAYQWPIYEIEYSGRRSFSDIRGPSDLVPHYKCVSKSGQYVAAPGDDDSCIMAHPTSFRFAVGEHVTFNLRLAFATGKSLSNFLA